MSPFSIIFGGLMGLLLLTIWASSTEIGERCLYMEHCYSICQTEDYVSYSSYPTTTCKCPCRRVHYPKETKTFDRNCIRDEYGSCTNTCSRTYGNAWVGLLCNKPSSTIGVVIDIKSDDQDQVQVEKNFGRSCTCLCSDYLKEIGF